MNKPWTVTITAPKDGQYTAYEGSSKTMALNHVDTARNVAVLCSSSIKIYLRNHGALYQTWDVQEGMFTTTNHSDNT